MESYPVQTGQDQPVDSDCDQVAEDIEIEEVLDSSFVDDGGEAYLAAQKAFEASRPPPKSFEVNGCVLEESSCEEDNEEEEADSETDEL